MLLCPFRHRTGTDALKVTAGSSPGLRALRGGQAEGLRCWDQRQTQDRRWHGPRAQGSRGQMVPQTLPTLGKPGQAGGRLWTWTGQRLQDAHLSHHCRGLPVAHQPGSDF